MAYIKRSFFVKVKGKENRKLQRVTAAYSLIFIAVSRLVCYQETSFIEWESMAENLIKEKTKK